MKLTGFTEFMEDSGQVEEDEAWEDWEEAWMFGQVTLTENGELRVRCIHSCSETAWTPECIYSFNGTGTPPRSLWDICKKLSEQEAKTYIHDHFLEIAR